MLVAVRKAKATIVSTSGVSVSHQLVRVVLKTLGYSRKKTVLVQARLSSNEIASREFLERCDRYETD
jgi:hypothetical protein